MSACQGFTLTKSDFEDCFYGIVLDESSSLEISNSQINNSNFTNIECDLNGGSIILNQIVSNGSMHGVRFTQNSTKVSSLEEKTSVNIFNSRIITNDGAGISVTFDIDQAIDININTVSVNGNRGCTNGIAIYTFSPEVGSTTNKYATARIQNVTIVNCGVGQDPSTIPYIHVYDNCCRNIS